MVTPLWDRAAEIALLAAALESRESRDRVRLVVTGGDFYDPRHEAVWQAMMVLDARGIPVDQVTLRDATGQKHNDVLVEAITCGIVPNHGVAYADVVQRLAVRRRIANAARQVIHEAEGAEASMVGWPSAVAARFRDIRDLASADAPDEAVAVSDLLAVDDVGADWVIPGLLERGDRFMLTGEEGLGKSHLLRQVAVAAAGGMDPFDFADQYQPVRVLVIDCENSTPKVRRALRPQVEHVTRWGTDPTPNLRVANTDRMNLLGDRDLARIHRMIDDHNPGLVVVGPLYRLAPGGLNFEEEAMTVLGALDSVRARGCALLLETHAGHDTIGYSKVRNLRPRGSSALLGWPEFGYGMRRGRTEGYADLERWRGDREKRGWPTGLRRADGFRWVPA